MMAAGPGSLGAGRPLLALVIVLGVSVCIVLGAAWAVISTCPFKFSFVPVAVFISACRFRYMVAIHLYVSLRILSATW